MSEEPSRLEWEERHRGRTAGGEPEPFLLEVLSSLPRGGLALDVAAGRGRHSLLLAASGFKVIAIDYSWEAMSLLGRTVRERRLPISPAVWNLDTFSSRDRTFDLIVNVNYLNRLLFPKLIRSLKPGGALLVDTFLTDQAAIGHPRNPDFLLKHYELRDLLGGLEIVRYREGLTVYHDQTRAWRASALAVRKENN